ncbi:MAG: tetratricopeptide repeat protein [Deltaproteobacteria bacterium]|nr:tetratricopeptide repeat protein [Deltaproteobacteria bacterium]
MAPNKRKILEAARKYVQKGAQDKALKEYGRLLKLDPRDAKLRLEIGDAHRRWGQVDEAIAAYTKVADQYMGEGFDARAVAVFKQIQGLDPERWASYAPLAELYQRMGLNSEAAQALQVAADGLHKDGEKREALELLRRMANLDPSNTASRIKVADLLRQEEMNSEAITEYEAALAEFDRQGETESSAKMLERILEVEPERLPALVGLARNLLERGLGQRAEPFVKQAIEIEADETAHHELLAEVYRSQGRDDELAATYRTLADVYRQRGDEDQARSITQRFVPPQDLVPSSDEGTQGFGSAEGLIDETLLDEEELLEEELLDEVVEEGPAATGPAAAHAAEATVLHLGDGSAAEVADSVGGLELSASEPEATEASPQGDPDQLLAEASVYLRYGKRVEAMRNLTAVLDADPVHRGAIEKLGEAHADGGDSVEAVAAWVKAAELAHASGDAEAVGVLRDRVAALDPEAAARLPCDAEVADAAPEEMFAEPDSADEPEALARSEEPLDLDPDEDIEIDASELDADFGDVLGTSLDDADSAPAASELESDADQDLPVPIGLAEPAEPTPDDTMTQQAAGDVDEEDLFASAASEVLGVDADAAAEPLALDGDEPLSLQAAAAEASQTAGGASSSVSLTAQVNDDLDEAEFYRQQGLLDEAQAIYERVLAVAPQHPLALVRMGEFAEARGDEAAADGEVESQAAAVSGLDADALAAAESQGVEAPSVNVAEPGSTALPGVEADALEAAEAASAGETGAERPDHVAGEPEAAPATDFFAPDDAEAPATDVFAPDDAEAPATDLFAPDDAEVAVGAATVSDATAAELSLDGEEEAAAEPGLDGAGEAAGADFDLAAELSGVFDAEGASDSGSGSSTSTGVGSEAEQDVLSAVFSEFKKGVNEQLGDGDHEAHYDLGIAYREMGLIEDAVGEFEIAVKSESRRLECLHLLGLCNLDRTRGDDAVTCLEAALDEVDPTADEATALHFDLGRAFESLGRIAEARVAWETVAAVDPSFGEVEERLAMLGESKPEAELDDDMESFEEFFEDESDESDAPDAVLASEEHESFEDLIAEANADAESEPAAAPPAADADAAPEPAPEREQDAEPEPVSKPKPRRKKKISFI